MDAEFGSSTFKFYILFSFGEKMKLVAYIYRRFLPVFAGATIFFSFVLILVDLLMNLWKLIVNQASPSAVFHLMMLYTPKTIWYAVPIAILFAASYVLSDLYANNELIVIFASGVSLFKFTAPLLALSFVMSFALFFFEDSVVVPTYAQKTELQNELLKTNQSKNNDKIVVLSDYSKIIYKADFYNDDDGRLFQLYLVVRNEDKSLDCIVYADSAFWSDDKKNWQLSNAMQYTVAGSTVISGPVQQEIKDRLIEPPETFRNNTISVEEVNTKEAREYISHLQRTGLPSAEAKSVYYKKFAFPFVVFIVVFLSIGLSGKTRKNVLLMSLALCIGSAVLFYVMQMITMLLAKFGYIPALLGAWFPVFLFVIISSVLLKYART